ncbi:glycoside hydrolase family 16 protein [Gloeophyllum trabeum ATCC 11539]|uniref:Glycoside hydrolase family 16 protein n=1 Tax=Gloeophyllum trabeum (strain ATCC 11539 / FP-39264 / Madison 617) TaxID=670483 RepID=S7S089_GLOTA|nr:glycoside hydrolase family 16 protein [Gloeophyllum trabeum ATCC 11539]EPQ59119.1 glycoside hydrolase family 16 protein [Gloeophyllum trabeum ATCC 11539]
MAVPRIPRNQSSFYTDSRYSFASTGSRVTSIADKFTLSQDPREWVTLGDLAEEDDELHAPTLPYATQDGKKVVKPKPETDRHYLSSRGVANLGCLVVLIIGVLGLFAGFPIAMYVTKSTLSNFGAFNIGGINASGQIPSLPGDYGIIDAETPKEAYTKTSWADGSELQLVFSDEFNVDGRTFWPGDDPYWEAVDLHYWETNNIEWYSPDQITTQDGSLVITLERKASHNLNYQGGMMSTWNKFCFTGGYIETNVELPGVNNVVGLWPAIWTMGNLGRAGYGASLEGLWPYTYDACDVGTVANQSINGQPVAATINGDQGKGGVLSYLPGQRLSRCTCPGESHPGPKHSDGTFVGRAAPEIDVFEAQITGTPLVAQVSQSAQWAPFNAGYIWANTSENEVIVDPSISQQNSFIGSATQQATSVVTATNQVCYEYEQGCYSIYGFEYKPGFDDAYITWISDNKISWTLNVAGLGPDAATEISARPVPQEPMYIIMNLGMSTNFGDVDLEHLPFPVHMRVDYIRVYQRKDSINIGCDPKDFPTQKYINEYLPAYANPNLTTWRGDFGQPWPKNSWLGEC